MTRTTCHFMFLFCITLLRNSTFWYADDYFFTRYPVVEKRLAQAGIRLALILIALILNRIFDGDKVDDIPLQVQ